MSNLQTTNFKIMHKEEQIKRGLEQLAQENPDIVSEVFSPDYIAHAGEKEHKGHEFIKSFANQLRTAIPDLKVMKVEFLGQEGEVITYQRTLAGTHRAEMMGIPASDEKVQWVDMVVARFENGKIAEEWVVSELAGELLLKQS